MRIKALLLHPTVQSIVLNFVRALSLVSLIWVMLSTIIDLNTNVRAMNAFDKDHEDFALVNCEYIELSGFLSYNCLFFY